MCLKTAGRVGNSIDPDQMKHSAASTQGLNYVLGPAYPNNNDNYGSSVFLAFSEHYVK